MTVADRCRLLGAFLVVGQTFGCAAGFADNPKSIPVGRAGLGRLEGRYAYSMPQCGGGCPSMTFSQVFVGFGKTDPPESTDRRDSEPAADDARSTVTLTIVDDRHIKATIYRGADARSEQLLAGKLDDKGFFVLETARIFHSYAGPLLWGYEERDARLGLDERGNLAVDVNVGGTAVFLILPFFGNGGPVWYTFDRRAEPRLRP